MLGALHPAGTTIVIAPLSVPPVAAVYVKLSVLPADPKPTVDGEPVSVPEPSRA